jgi:hypothetical protein
MTIRQQAFNCPPYAHEREAQRKRRGAGTKSFNIEFKAQDEKILVMSHSPFIVSNSPILALTNTKFFFIVI